LTAEQLPIMTRVSERTKKGAPREEFEKLFRRGENEKLERDGECRGSALGPARIARR